MLVDQKELERCRRRTRTMASAASLWIVDNVAQRPIGTPAKSEAGERRPIWAVRRVVGLARRDNVQRSALPRPAVRLECGDECRSRRPPPSARAHGHRADRHGSTSPGAGHRSTVRAQAPAALAQTRKSAQPLGIEPAAIPTARTEKEP